MFANYKVFCALELPEMVTAFHYECGREFFLQPLHGMLGEKQTYGIITLEAGEGAIAWLRGTQLKVCTVVKFPIPNKNGQGGQSNVRFSRLHDEAVRHFCQLLGRDANNILLGLESLAGILVSGPGMTKLEFLKDGELDYRLRAKILGVIDVGYSGQAGVRETIQRGGKLLTNLRFIKEEQWIEDFFTRVVKNDPLVIYGKDEIHSALLNGRVATIFVSDSVASPALSEVITAAEHYGTTVEVLSSHTEKGEMFIKTFGGWGAILRY